ncbi:hypothetical protein [Kitasatospora sp. NPDC058218]|uniref:hypothetical protein n=1 Tax=Kitasatospora sp. NPDC058218 TaxID=3346385 RepID=UPI0036DB3C74
MKISRLIRPAPTLRTPSRLRRGLAGVGMGVAALVLAGCGGGQHGGPKVASLGNGSQAGSSASPSPGAAKPEDAQLQFARCMRDKGVDVPDPQAGGSVRLGGPGQDPTKVQAALQECQHFLSAGGSSMNDPKRKDMLTKVAQCMREHGVNMQDPDGSGLRVEGDVDPQTMDAANKACQSVIMSTPAGSAPGSGAG